MPPDFPDRDQIASNINEAKRLGGVNDSISAVSPNAGSAGGKAEQTPSSTAVEPVPTASPATMSAVAGTVTLDAALKDQTSPDDTVFIYARPAS